MTTEDRGDGIPHGLPAIEDEDAFNSRWDAGMRDDATLAPADQEAVELGDAA